MGQAMPMFQNKLKRNKKKLTGQAVEENGKQKPASKKDKGGVTPETKVVTPEKPKPASKKAGANVKEKEENNKSKVTLKKEGPGSITPEKPMPASKKVGAKVTEKEVTLKEEKDVNS